MLGSGTSGELSGWRRIPLGRELSVLVTAGSVSLGSKRANCILEHIKVSQRCSTKGETGYPETCPYYESGQTVEQIT